ncbi:MAG TPA: adenylate/guanylate cyclase domain-containing protein [Candidatus Melainabacteria bacterium]|nr:adenylate/guanylate cyclase domain-containing protein [Candidatus Melainabacteria bacterium]
MKDGLAKEVSKVVGVSSKDLSWRALAVCFLVGVAVLGIECFNVPILSDTLSAMENSVTDHFIRFRDNLDSYKEKRAADTNSVVLVTLDPESGRRLGLNSKQPWSRALFARLIDQLTKGGAEVIGFDVDLEESSGASTVAKKASDEEMDKDDVALCDVLKRVKNIVISTNVDTPDITVGNKSKPRVHAPYEPFVVSLGADGACLGNAYINVDRDGLVRKATLVFEKFGHSTAFYKSFALRVAEKYLGARAMVDQSHDHVFLKDKIFPAEFRINFAGGKGSFTTIPLWRALDWQKHFQSSATIAKANGLSNDTTNSPFVHKVVLIGFGESSFMDTASNQPRQSAIYESSFATPVSEFDNRMPAIEVQANIISNLITGKCLPPPSRWKMIIAILIAALACGQILGFLVGRPIGSFLSIVGISLLWFALSFFLFFSFGQVIPSVVPITAVVLPCWLLVLADQNFYFFRERRRHTRLFRSMTAKHIARQIDRAQLAELGLDGKRCQVTVMVCRVRDFMDQVDPLPPDRIFQIFNDCLGIMVNEVFEHRGIVDRIASYGVIAFWGAPLPLPGGEQAKQAAECALSIKDKINNYCETQSEEIASLALRSSCGIETGEAFCGTIDAGSRDTQFAQYSVMGDPVEEALALEALNNTYGTSFLLGAGAARLVEDSLEVRQIDKVILNGSGEKQSLFELLTTRGSLPAAMEEAMAIYRNARQSFDNGDIKEAEQMFATILKMVPSDQPTSIMLKRCRELLNDSGEAVSSGIRPQ